MASRIRLSDGHREWLATVNDSSVTIDGIDGEFVVTPRPDGRWTVTHKGQVTAGTAIRAPQHIWTGIEGATAQWNAQPASTRTRQKVADDNVRAPMSATVLRVHVSVGDAVKDGDPLVVVEAMKMEMPLRAPRGGIVKAIHCLEGDLVAPDTVLVELE